MKCPFCGWLEHKVLDSRPARDNEAVRRRRECEGCGRRFTTFEAPDIPRVMVVKRNGSREEFRAEKVLQSMALACRKRPPSLETLRDAACRIERELVSAFEDEVSSATIGRRALEELREIDTVAFVRFASVYLEFQTLEDFGALVQSGRHDEDWLDRLAVT